MANVIPSLDKKSMHTLRAARRRSSHGVSIVELGAALAFGLPLVVALLFATLETSHYFTIRTNIDIAARNTARAIAIEFGKNPAIGVAGYSGTAVTDILTASHIPKFVENNAQYTISFSAAPPQSVTVTCIYPNKALQTAYGLPPFPNPDPFQLGNTFVVRSFATFVTE